MSLERAAQAVTGPPAADGDGQGTRTVGSLPELNGPRDLSEFGDARVVVVDDEPANVLLLQRLLTRAGLRRVETFTDSRQALSRCEAEPPDLLLADLRMPHLDGIGLLRALRSDLPPGTFLPVVVLTADTTAPARDAALSAGATDFLTKPFDGTEVLLRVGNLLHTRLLFTELERLLLMEDRERIAADLHDTVIQRLFGVGMALEATRSQAPRELADRIGSAVSEIDETIRQIRSSIFALQSPPTARRGLRSEILALATEAAAGLGFEPHVRLDGPLDSRVGSEVAEQLLPTLREALANVVRHARATRVDVAVQVTPTGEVVATVRDDGVGIGRGHRPGGKGVGNMARRAEALGGTATLESPGDGNGTTLTWRVPAGEPGATAR